MKKYFALMALLAAAPVFADCEVYGRGRFVAPKQQDFKALQGVWIHEQEMTGIFEIRPEGGQWFYVTYDFERGRADKKRMQSLANGAFLREQDGGSTYYQGYDAVEQEIMSFSEGLCRIGGSARIIPPGIHSAEGYTHVRRGPSNKHAVIRTVPNGTRVWEIDASEHNQSNSPWREVVYFHYPQNLIGTGFIHRSQIR